MPFSTVCSLVFLLTSMSISFINAELRICHTNDFHAKYNEVGAQNVNCKWYNAVANKCYSGIARLTTAMRSLKCDVKVQAGDWVQGSLLDTVFHETIAIAAYSWVNYDFATFGNHEFDTGTSLINTTLRATTPGMTWISSNVKFTDPTMTDLPVNRWVDKHGICWVSVTTTTTQFTSSPGDTVEFGDEKKSIKKAIKKCEQQNNVIAITHQGYDEDVKMCEEVKEIDLIIGGHTHTDMSNGEYPVKIERKDGSVCWVTQTFAHGRYIGVLDLGFNNGEIYFTTTSYLATDFRIKRDPEVLLKLQLFNNQVNERVDVKIGFTTGIIYGGSRPCRGGTECIGDDDNCECSMGNLVCDAMIDSVGGVSAGVNPTVCIMNGGSFRNSFSKGDIKVRDVVNVLPFGNELVTFTMTGADIINTLEYGLSAILPDTESGPFIGGLGNMEVTATVVEDGDDVKIEKVIANGVPLDMAAEYTVLTNSYIAGGGDGYTWPVEGENIGTLLRELTQAYLEKNNPYTPVIGRLHVDYKTESEKTAASSSGSASEFEMEGIPATNVGTEGGSAMCDSDSCGASETEAKV